MCIQRCNFPLGYRSMPASRQVPGEFEAGESKLNHPTDLHSLAFEQRSNGSTAMRARRFHPEPAIGALASGRLEGSEFDRLTVVVHRSRQRGKVKIRGRHQDARHVCRRRHLGAPPQSVDQPAVAGEEQQAAITGLHRIDGQPSPAAYRRQRFQHTGARAGSVGIHSTMSWRFALIGFACGNRLTLGLVVDQDLRAFHRLEVRCHIPTVDHDPIAAPITLAGGSRFAVKQNASLEHPFLDFTARTQAMLGEHLVQAFGQELRTPRRIADRPPTVGRIAACDQRRGILSGIVVRIVFIRCTVRVVCVVCIVRSGRRISFVHRRRVGRQISGHIA